MKTLLASPPRPASPEVARKQALLKRLGAIVELAQESPHMFVSPLGPFQVRGCSVELPRFVFFGPHASDASWRLALLAGFSAADLCSSLAIISLAERLLRDPESGHGLYLSLFPVVDAAGAFLSGPDRALGSEHWGLTTAPELRLLERDIRQNGYHGFIRIETCTGEDSVASVRLRGSATENLSPDLELISSEEAGPIPVRFEAEGSGAEFGPLSLADDLPYQPFELTLSLPVFWPNGVSQNAAALLLQRFLWRYRAFQSHGQHL